MTEHLSFLREIIADPDNDDPRLIYADWLEEHGDPRGAFIRAQCAGPNAAPSESSPSQEQLDLEKRWQRRFHQSQFNDTIGVPYFQRGFLRDITLNAHTFLEQGRYIPTLRRELLQINLTFAASRVRQLSLSRDFSKFAGLNLANNALGTRRLGQLLRCESLNGLLSLDLSFNEIRPSGARPIRKAEQFHNLAALNLNANYLGDDGAEELSLAKNMTALRRLNLSANQISWQGVESLANAAFISTVAILQLDNNYLGRRGAIELSQHAQCAGIQYLSLENNAIGDDGIDHLANSPLVTQLRYLNLRKNGITERGVKALADSPYLTKLRFLNLRGNRIEDISSIARARFFSKLTTLNLLKNAQVTRSSISALENASNHHPDLRIQL